MKINKLDDFDSGSNYNFSDKSLPSRSPRSLFDLSHTVTTTIKHCGILQPITMWETIPGDDFDISVDSLVRVMPQVVPLYSRQRLKLYAFYSRYADLWNNWQVFMDKGYTGNVSKQIPYLTATTTHSASATKVLPDSLQDCLGLPIGATISSLQGANISMLPFMMYLRIYRDYFMNRNEWINDRILLPDDDSRFRLGDDGNLLSAADLSKVAKVSFDTNDLNYDGSGNLYYGLLYHEYADDYFTTALPFTQRGNTPALKKNIDTSELGLDFSASVPTDSPGTYHNFVVGADTPEGLFAGDLVYNSNMYRVKEFNGGASLVKDALNKGKITGTNVGVEITLEDIRGLAITQQIMESLARTDGSYAQFGLTFFGEVSKSAMDFRPIYIGGAYKNMVFTEVLQTSGQIVDDDEKLSSTPLGTYAGHGITGISSGRIGHVHCDDYGLIMIIGCIMPDVFYSQGLERIWTDSLQEQKYLPDRAKLGMQPIYNKELFYAGNNGSDVGEDNYLWAYQNPFDNFRYIPNRVKGKLADSTSLSFIPYTQSRIFTQLPNWGHAFSVADPDNVRRDYLTAPDEDNYTGQFAFNIRAVRPLPYKPIPARIV